ncbi:hypothetical protein [Bacillus sp. JCM 19041]|uniref:hypothetical protein n=1 Tax=Bacillus sp. JCM 19041 TaxID=1460637 RepID=UPI0006D125BF
MGWGRDSYSCGCDRNYSYNNYNNNNYNNNNKSECDCDDFFKHISRGEEVKVFLKGGGRVEGEFVDVRGNVVNLANADCHSHCKKVKIIAICCDDITAVEV